MRTVVAAATARRRLVASIPARTPPVGPAGCRHSSNVPKVGGVVTAQAFLDLNWMEQQLVHGVAKKKFGDRAPDVAVLDLAPLRAFVEKRLSETLGIFPPMPVTVTNPVAAAAPPSDATAATASAPMAPTSLKVTHMYGYGSFARGQRGMDVLRACTDDGIATRNFPPVPVMALLPAGATFPSHLAVPAGGGSGGEGGHVLHVPSPSMHVALAVDMLHACAVRGSVDTGTSVLLPPTPSTTGGVSLAPFAMASTEVVVAAMGTPLYFPALVRAQQHGKTVVVASTRADWARLALMMLPEQRDTTVPLLLDDVLEACILSRTAFAANAMPLPAVADALHSHMRGHARAGEAWSGVELASAAAELGLLKELRRNDSTLRSLVNRFPRLFKLTQVGERRWEALALSTTTPSPPASGGSAPPPTLTGKDGGAPSSSGPTRPMGRHHHGHSHHPHGQASQPRGGNTMNRGASSGGNNGGRGTSFSNHGKGGSGSGGGGGPARGSDARRSERTPRTSAPATPSPGGKAGASSTTPTGTGGGGAHAGSSGRPTTPRPTPRQHTSVKTMDKVGTPAASSEPAPAAGVTMVEVVEPVAPAADQGEPSSHVAVEAPANAEVPTKPKRSSPTAKKARASKGVVAPQESAAPPLEVVAGGTSGSGDAGFEGSGGGASDPHVHGLLALAAGSKVIPSAQSLKAHLITIAQVAGLAAPKGGKKARKEDWEAVLVKHAAEVAKALAAPGPAS